MPDRPYLFYELTNSLCATCLRKVEAKVVIRGRSASTCTSGAREHRFQKVLISTDAEYYKLSRQTLKPGQMPLKFNTPIKYGCPYDCGLCPDHEQHSLPDAGGDHRPVQPDLPDLLQRVVAAAADASRRWSRSSSCSTAWCATRASRTSCRSAAASRRSIRISSTMLDAAKAPADQAPDGQHQRHPDRAATPDFARRLDGLHAGL